MIELVTGDRYMPPWHPEQGVGEFRDARRLTDDEIARIAQWVSSGMPEGDPALAPALPEFPEGWQLGEPDMVIEMPEEYAVPADGPDIYRNFVLPVELEEDRWVTAVELRTTARTSVHHCLYFLDDTGDARKQDEAEPGPGFESMGFRRTGDLGGWAVGATPRLLPGGLARPLKKGSDLILSMHFHPSGKPEKEKTRIGLHFAEKPPERTLVGFMVPPQYGARAGLDIPAGEADYRMEESIKVPVDVELVLTSGHAHYLCKSMRADAVDAAGNAKPLISIPRWDFNWQGQYEYSKFVSVPAGTEIRSQIVYDNSTGNLENPNHPPRRVTWGLESTDEMGSVIFHAVPKNEDDAEFLWLWSLALEWGGGRRNRGFLRRVKQADPNGDGVIERAELKDPITLAYFKRLDFDGDGVINYKQNQRLVPGGRAASLNHRGRNGASWRRPSIDPARRCFFVMKRLSGTRAQKGPLVGRGACS